MAIAYSLSEEASPGVGNPWSGARVPVKPDDNRRIVLGRTP